MSFFDELLLGEAKNQREKQKIEYPSAGQNILGLMAYGVFVAIVLSSGIMNLQTNIWTSLTSFICSLIYIVISPHVFLALRVFPKILTIALMFYSIVIFLQYFPKIL